MPRFVSVPGKVEPLLGDGKSLRKERVTFYNPALEYNSEGAWGMRSFGGCDLFDKVEIVAVPPFF